MYVHRRYEAVLDPGLSEARRRLPADFNYTVVKYAYATGNFSFITSPDFDSAPEPVVADVVTVASDGSVRLRKPPSDPYIYHHKWLFVKDDYPGFDVAKSKTRSADWMVLEGIDYRRIGRKSHWEAMLVPRLSSTWSLGEGPRKPACVRMPCGLLHQGRRPVPLRTSGTSGSGG